MRLYGDNQSLYQWDTGRRVTSENFSAGDEVHFANAAETDALVVEVKALENGDLIADIPNVLLQYGFPLHAYWIKDDGAGCCCADSKTFWVTKREKPSDYIYTETELKNFEAFETRIKALEKYNSGSYPIKYVESLDEENFVNLRDLESDMYILYGYFKPFPGSDSTLIIDRGFYLVTRVEEGSHLLSISPLNFRMTCHEILVDETNEKGFTYTNTRINLLDLVKPQE